MRASRIAECLAALRECSQAAARWDLEASRTILRRRKMLLAAALLPALAGIGLQYAAAEDLLPKMIPVLGGSKAFIPAAVNGRMFCGSILVGLVAGLITGVIGAGGGYILTPALMSFGVRGIMAVGTDQFHLFAKAIMGTVIHRRLGNVHTGLAAWFVAGSLCGVTLGGHVNRTIFQHSPAMSDVLISSAYVVVLGSLGLFSIVDWRRASRRPAPSSARTDETGPTAFARRLQSIPLRPRIRFDRDMVEGGRSISVYPVIACGFVVGFAAAIMGVGGGFLTFPMFVYGLGVSTFTTVGTDILQIIFTTSYSSIFQYAAYGFVFYSVSVGMLAGSIIGVQVGAMVTQMVTGASIRAFYSLTILAGFANRLCALPRKLADLGYLSLGRPLVQGVERAGTVVFFAVVGVFALWILAVFARGAARIRAREAAARGDSRRGPLVRPGRFAAGIAGLAAFATVFTCLLLPGADGITPLRRADSLFNRFTKGSSCVIPEARKRAARFAGQSVDYGVRPREMADTGSLVRVLRANGIGGSVTEDGRVRIAGRLDALARAALADADAAYSCRADADPFVARYGLTDHEAMYCWWILVDGLTRRFVQDGRAAEAEFTNYLTRKVLEPAYNFMGIRSARIRDDAWPAVFLLVFYVAYTLWYGFSVMFVFDGLGLSASAPRKER